MNLDAVSQNSAISHKERLSEDFNMIGTPDNPTRNDEGLILKTDVPTMGQLNFELKPRSSQADDEIDARHLFPEAMNSDLRPIPANPFE